MDWLKLFISSIIKIKIKCYGIYTNILQRNKKLASKTDKDFAQKEIIYSENVCHHID